MQICATLVCNTKNSDEQSIICVNYVLSGPQYPNVVMDQYQVNQPQTVRIKPDVDEDLREDSSDNKKGAKRIKQNLISQVSEMEKGTSGTSAASVKNSQVV